jgi:hypothetical protein
MRTRDASILDAVRKTDLSATVKNVLVQGHDPLFYACTTLVDEKGRATAARTPLYRIDPTQVTIIERLLGNWSQAVHECEGAPILRGNELSP